MKKRDLTKLIENKKLLNETIEIMDEIGYDNEETKAFYHGNYLDDLSKVFHEFDQLALPLIDAFKNSIYADDIKNTQPIINNFHNFMVTFQKYIQSKIENVDKSEDDMIDNNRPVPLGLDQIGGIPSGNDPKINPRLNENQK